VPEKTEKTENKVETEKPAEETTAEEESEITAEEKPKREKPQRKKKEEKGVFNYYKIDGESLTRQRPFCERCGPGYFMANHSNRFTCGHCGFTRYKQETD
jgi:small subunit ribosomal protein S27Ae